MKLKLASESMGTGSRALLAALLLASALRAQPSLSAGAVVDAASMGRVFAPGMWISIMGAGFTPDTLQATSVPLPTVLDGVSVELDDGQQVQPAPLLFVSPTQINAQLPFNVASTLAVRVRNADGVSGADTITVIDRAPRFFAGAGGTPLIFHLDATQVTDSAPAAPGEALVGYVTGLGEVDPPVDAGNPPGDTISTVTTPVTAAVGNLPANVTFAGLTPQAVGLYQVNFALPAALDSGSYPVMLAAGTQQSQTGLAFAVVKKTAAPREYYAAPGGTPDGDGSRDHPWDLATALRPAPAIQPGDTLWLRGGSYGNGSTIFESRLAGTAEKNITVRQVAGERAIINGSLAIYAPNTWYWGFEVTSTIADRGSTRGAPECVDTYDGTTGVKLINLVLHDCAQGIGFWVGAQNGEAYGNLIYYNGYQDTDRGHGHGIYTQNQTGTKVISDNIIFDQFGLGIQAYGSVSAFVQGYQVQGNIIFNNGSISTGATNVDNILFAIGIPMQRILVEDNWTYHPPDSNKGYSRLGWSFSSALNQDVTVRRNYWIGGISAVELWNWSQVTFSGNTVYSKDALNAVLTLAAGQNMKAYAWDKNTYYGRGVFRLGENNQGWDAWRSLTGLDASSQFTAGAPQGTWTLVRPNKYEAGRANIAIYNWDLKARVAVDVSAVLKAGDVYEVRDAQNFFGAPVAAGTYDGSPVAIPMNGLQIAAPVGTVPAPPVHTAPQFGAFILLKKS